MKELRNEKVLVTGATGFVGSHLCRRLLREGAIVRILARKTANKQLLKEFEDAGVGHCMGRHL